jgi:hypothetical protein
MLKEGHGGVLKKEAISEKLFEFKLKIKNYFFAVVCRAEQRDRRPLAAEIFSFIPDPSSPAVRHPDSKFGRDRDTIPSPLLTSARV